MTFAEYMDLALYHTEGGYYARAARRSGRAGDFFTSVDVGPVFGELLAVQLAEMWRVLSHAAELESWRASSGPEQQTTGTEFDLVEAGCGSGRLARDVLDAAAARDPEFYKAIRLSLVERSPVASAAQVETLGPHAQKLRHSDEVLPDAITGAVVANELLDAFPVHIVTATESGLQEVYVDAEGDSLVERPGNLSSPRLETYLNRVGARLEPGWRVEVNLAAVDWIADAARRLRRGFLMIIDYGHHAHELYSELHAAGTVATYRRHAIDMERRRLAALEDPGERDITADVDLTSITLAAVEAGLQTLGVLDQTYFLLGLGLADFIQNGTGDPVTDLKRRLALKTLMLPGGLGSTHKVLIFGKDVGSPGLLGFSYRVRIT